MKTIILLIIIMTFVASCNQKEQNTTPVQTIKTKAQIKSIKSCTADVKECADGSYIGRDPENNCKFEKCPNGEKSLM